MTMWSLGHPSHALQLYITERTVQTNVISDAHAKVLESMSLKTSERKDGEPVSICLCQPDHALSRMLYTHTQNTREPDR